MGRVADPVGDPPVVRPQALPTQVDVDAFLVDVRAVETAARERCERVGIDHLGDDPVRFEIAKSLREIEVARIFVRVEPQRAFGSRRLPPRVEVVVQSLRKVRLEIGRGRAGVPVARDDDVVIHAGAPRLSGKTATRQKPSETAWSRRASCGHVNPRRRSHRHACRRRCVPSTPLASTRCSLRARPATARWVAPGYRACRSRATHPRNRP